MSSPTSILFGVLQRGLISRNVTFACLRTYPQRGKELDLTSFSPIMMPHRAENTKQVFNKGLSIFTTQSTLNCALGYKAPWWHRLIQKQRSQRNQVPRWPAKLWSAAGERVEGGTVGSGRGNSWRSVQTGQGEAFTGRTLALLEAASGELGEACTLPLSSAPSNPLLSLGPAPSHQPPMPCLCLPSPLSLRQFLTHPVSFALPASYSVSQFIFSSQPSKTTDAIPHHCSLKQLKILPTDLTFSSET